jgi:hypothetical protein
MTSLDYALAAMYRQEVATSLIIGKAFHGTS